MSGVSAGSATLDAHKKNVESLRLGKEDHDREIVFKNVKFARSRQEQAKQPEGYTWILRNEQGPTSKIIPKGDDVF